MTASASNLGLRRDAACRDRDDPARHLAHARAVLADLNHANRPRHHRRRLLLA